jgi:hypothetical protein
MNSMQLTLLINSCFCRDCSDAGIVASGEWPGAQLLYGFGFAELCVIPYDLKPLRLSVLETIGVWVL